MYRAITTRALRVTDSLAGFVFVVQRSSISISSSNTQMPAGGR